MNIIKELKYPFQTTPIITISLFALVLDFMVKSPLMMFVGGMYLWVLAISMYMEYGYEIVQVSSEGKDEAPMLEIEKAILFFGERRFLKHIVLFAFVFFILSFFELHYSNELMWLVIIIISSLMPASIAVNVLDNRFLQTMNPIVITRFIIRIGVAYCIPACLIFIVSYIIWQLAIHKIEYIFLSLCLISYLGVLIFRVIGSLISLQQGMVDHHVEVVTELSPEQQKTLDEKQVDKNISKMYQLVNVDRDDDAYKILESMLAQSNWGLDKRLYEELIKWQYKNLARMHSRGYVSRLLKAGDYAKAWEVTLWCISSHAEFALQNLQDTSKLVSSATTNKQSNVAVTLLLNLKKTIVDSQGLPEADFQAATILLQNLDKEQEAFKLLQSIAQNNPKYASTDKFKKFYKLVNNIVNSPKN